MKLHVPIVQSLATPAPLSDNYVIVKNPTEQIHGCTNKKRYKKDNNLSPLQRAQQPIINLNGKLESAGIKS